MYPPLVSVNMVVYNGERFITNAIQSIIDQTYQNFELVIVEDGSTDDTLNLINAFRDPRIRLIINETNQGVVNARNAAVRKSQGDFVAILDSDDISLPNRLEMQTKFLTENPDYGLIGSKAELINVDGKSLNKTQSLSLSANETKVYLLFKNCFTHSTVMYKREVLSRFMFNKEVPSSEDYDLIVKIASVMKVRNLDDVLSKYRVHDKNISKKDGVIEKNQRKIVYNQLVSLGIMPTRKEIEIHLDLTKKFKHLNIDKMLIIAEWLDKLLIANKESKRFPEQTIYDKLSDHWFNIFNNSYNRNLKLYRQYIKSPILAESSKTAFDHFKFFIKCLINLQ
jgi:glycosyltransferase involved in cell wall biosynthesis